MRWRLLATTALVACAAASPAAADPVSLGIAALTAYAGGVISAATTVGFVAALTSTTALVAGIVGGVGAAASALLAPTVSVPDAVLNQQLASQASAEPRRIIYGRTRVGPNVTYSASTNENGKDRNLHLVHVLAGHECDGLDEIWFDDEKVWDSVTGWGTFNGKELVRPSNFDYASFTFHSGAQDQEADPALVSRVEEWSAAHRGRGVAWVYLHLVGKISVFSRGVPGVTYVVRGAKVHDPRSGTTAWSDNPALIINDWVLNSRYGYREKARFWDEAAVIAAANICDEAVALAEGGTEKRYTFGGAFRANVDKEDVLRGMLTSCMGMTPREGPRRRLLAAAYRTPVLELIDDDLAGKVDMVNGKAGRETHTGVRGRFQSPDANYILDDYPEVISDAHDPANGDPKYLPLDLPFTPSAATAQRLAKLTLLAQAQRITGSAEWKLKALRLRAGDTFMWTSARYGFAQKVFEVTDRALVVDGEPPRMRIAITCRETGPAVHDWTTSDQAPYIAGVPTSLPDPFSIDPPGLVISDELRVVAQQVATVLIAMPTSSSNNAAGFQVQARKLGAAQPINIGMGESGHFELAFVEDGTTYEVRARATTVTGSTSDWTSWKMHVVAGKTAPPSDVTGFGVSFVATSAHLSWDPSPDLDLSHYQVRFQPVLTGAGWDSAIDVAPRVARPATSVVVPAMVGTYLIKAADKSGGASVSAATIVSNAALLESLNAVETAAEAPPFAGTFAQTEELGGEVRLAREAVAPFFGTIADVGALDDWGAVGRGDHLATGTYQFAAPVDLGAVYTCRLTASMTVRRHEDGKGFGAVPDIGAVLDWGAIGTSTGAGDVTATMEISTTDDDPSGSPVWSAWSGFRIGDYTARGFRFRVALATLSAAATPAVSAMSAAIDMPDRRISAKGVATGAGTRSVTFSPAFRALTQVLVTVTDGETGDWFSLANDDADGFDITVRNSSGTPVDRTINYDAVGYGAVGG